MATHSIHRPSASDRDRRTEDSRRARQHHSVRHEESSGDSDSQISQGSRSDLQSIPAADRPSLTQAAIEAQNLGLSYVEWTLPNGETLWFTPDQVLSAFGSSQKTRMAQAGTAPGPRGAGQARMGSASMRVASFGENIPLGEEAQPMMRTQFTGYEAYGPGNPLYEAMMGGQMREQVAASRQEIRKMEQQTRAKMRMILFMILTGDVVGAMRSVVFESERDNRIFNRILLKQLNGIRKAKSKVLMAMGRKKPPTAHDNTNDPAGAARDQNKQATYTQWVTITTNLMQEISQTERELTDEMAEGRRQVNDRWEALKGLADNEDRTNQALLRR